VIPLRKDRAIMPWIEEVKVWRLTTKGEIKELDVMKVFISYKRDVKPDELLALRLYEALREHCDVFIDQAMPMDCRKEGRGRALRAVNMRNGFGGQFW
jgi:hypothetical protein